MAQSDWLSLFPLNTILFPAGVLPLRVFETRYIDMVRDCMKSNTPFGVVAIKAGQEVGAAAEPYAVGTLAMITQWDMPEFGVLLIQTRGGERFRILETRLLPGKRLEARVEMVAADTIITDDDDVLPVCANVLRVVIEDLQQRARAAQANESISPDLINPFPEPIKLDDVSWVANRWCEILPIDLEQKQQLLEMSDPLQRLQQVRDYLQKHGVV